VRCVPRSHRAAGHCQPTICHKMVSQGFFSHCKCTHWNHHAALCKRRVGAHAGHDPPTPNLANVPGARGLCRRGLEEVCPRFAYEAGSAYRIQPYLRSNARAVDRSLALKTRYSVTVRGCQSRASATSRGNTTEHPQVRQNTRLTAVHREVRPSRQPPARSPRRVRARRRGPFVFKMRFHIAKVSLTRYWVNCD